MPVPGDGDGVGDGDGDGRGVGDGVGTGVPGLLEREGTPLLVTGVGDVGSTDPQLIDANATASEARTMGMRIRGGPVARHAPMRNGAGVGGKLHVAPRQRRTACRRCNV